MFARCIDHLERYIRKCVAEDKEPVSPDAFRKDAILICEDITCGIVPVSVLDRKWRELTGRYLQRLTGAGAEVTRVFCGFAQKMGRIRKCEEPNQEELTESKKGESAKQEKEELKRHRRLIYTNHPKPARSFCCATGEPRPMRNTFTAAAQTGRSFKKEESN